MICCILLLLPNLILPATVMMFMNMRVYMITFHEVICAVVMCAGKLSHNHNLICERMSDLMSTMNILSPVNLTTITAVSNKCLQDVINMII